MHRLGAFFLSRAALLGLALLLPRPAAAAWPTDPSENLPLCTAPSAQRFPTIVSDGVGGAIVAWQDFRSGNWDIYAQRVSADGALLWTEDGVVLPSHASERLPSIVSDGAGGAIVVWQSGPFNYEVYAQRISAGGALLWAEGGVALCDVERDQSSFAVVPDGAGGAIVTWQDQRSGNADIYARRISADGTVQWTDNGVALCTATGRQQTPVIVSDGAGGAIVIWSDERTVTTAEIYARRISAGGTLQWAADGVALSSATGALNPTAVSDGAGGAIVAWEDHRNGGGNIDIYARRISADGAVRWTANGVALCTAAAEQIWPGIVSDGAGGAIVAWEDARLGRDNHDIYSQRILADGTVPWAADGVALCTGANYQGAQSVTPDGAGGAIVAWCDGRSGNEVYSQRISADGAVQWPADGVLVCTYPIYARDLPRIVSDGTGGAIVTWFDSRNGDAGDPDDIYAQRVQANGQLGGDAWVDVPPERPLAFALDPVRPNPLRGGTLTVHFTLASATPASLELLDVAGRRIARREVGSLGAGRHALGLGDGCRLAPGLYLVCLRRGTDTRVRRVAVLE